MTPEEIQGRILYRDALMLVINKPPGIAVHQAHPNAVSRDAHLEQYFPALQFGLPKPPQLAHRLDKDTSGCLVLGRHRKALDDLAKLFREGLMSKTYWAVVKGGPYEDEGFIDLPLGRMDQSKGWWMKPDPNGLPSQTGWKVMGRAEGSTLLELTPYTGRTHQLRVHTQAMGWPIIGDPIYGDGKITGERLHLHARSITIPLYKNKPPIKVEAPAPDHMIKRMVACGYSKVI
jgi:tRNA pseudouridine32 synthase/23S rRNA pseudouridine746 synthase